MYTRTYTQATLILLCCHLPWLRDLWIAVNLLPHSNAHAHTRTYTQATLSLLCCHLPWLRDLRIAVNLLPGSSPEAAASTAMLCLLLQALQRHTGLRSVEVSGLCGLCVCIGSATFIPVRLYVSFSPTLSNSSPRIVQGPDFESETSQQK